MFMLQLETQNLHPSTLLCLEALQRLHLSHDCHDILDLGCGNGILSVVAAQIWPKAQVVAADISPKAVDNANAVFKEKQLESHVRAIRSEGFSHPLIGERAPYDLIFCNLLASVLLPYAPDIKKHIKTGGYVILSGIQAWQGTGIEHAYKGLGFEIIDKIELSPWLAYIACHKKET